MRNGAVRCALRDGVPIPSAFDGEVPMSEHLKNIEGMENGGANCRKCVWRTRRSKWWRRSKWRAINRRRSKALAQGVRDGLRYQTPFGRHGLGQDTSPWPRPSKPCRSRRSVLAPNKTHAAPVGQRAQRVLPAQFRRLFRQLLRLLPAGSVRADDGHVYRKGRLHQRRGRKNCATLHERAALAA